MLVVLAVVVVLGHASSALVAPLAQLEASPVSLDPAYLPQYAARTTLRMLAAMLLSLVFTFTYATLAAKSRRAGQILVPMLDVLQSVPILGFISVTVVFFMSLAPGRVLGAELASIFAIFTSQAWNMAFSFYQSLRTVPKDLEEAARSMRLTAWMKFWRLEVPFAVPGLVWNMMMSMSGGWFFVVASEAISVGSTTVTLPGIGSYIALAIEKRDIGAVFWAIGAMAVVILIYDQLFFRPLVAWSDRFRPEQQPGVQPPTSWALTAFRRSRIVASALWPVRRLWAMTFKLAAAMPSGRASIAFPGGERTANAIWLSLTAACGAYAVWAIVSFLRPVIGIDEVVRAMLLSAITLLRVLVLVFVASLIWVPVGVLVGLKPALARIIQPLAQFLAAFPANLLFPLAVLAIVSWRLNPDIWLSPLMILGTQWYILFNVIAGAAVMPREFLDAGANFQVKGWAWWRSVALPAIFPHYVTGAITASGGSFNASIVAEAVTWGNDKVVAHGIGSYIAEATAKGDFPRIVLGIAVMSAIVILVNRMLWRPLYNWAETRFRLD